MKKGFTLIELLVVITIISLLSSVILAGVRDAREKAIVSAQRAYMKEIIKAIELYRLDTGIYPTSSTIEILASGLLSNYIKWAPIHSSIATTGTSVWFSTAPFHSCGTSVSDKTKEPYVLHFTSTKNNLKLPTLYTLSSPTANTYCASLIAS